MADGEIEPTFRWKQQLQGAHAGSEKPEYNQVGIGICLIGDFESDHPSEKQLRAVKLLVQTLKQRYAIRSQNIIGHGDIRSTKCPGKNFPLAEVAGVEHPLPFAQVSPGLSTPGLANVPGSPLR